MSSLNRRRLVFAFALSDGIGSYLGSIIGAYGWRSYADSLEIVGPLAVACYGLFVLYLTWQSGHLASSCTNSWLTFILPVCLSLDNLATGIALESTGGSAISNSLMAAAVSGCLAQFGMIIGSVLTTHTRRSMNWLSGGAMIAVALLLFCKDAMS